LDEEVKTAESEVKQADSRLQDAKERLTDVKTRTEAKDAELAKRKTAASDKLNSHAREAEEASVKIDQAKADQSMDRAVASGDKGAVSVQLHDKVDSSKMTVSRDCRVFER